MVRANHSQRSEIGRGRGVGNQGESGGRGHGRGVGSGRGGRTGKTGKGGKRGVVPCMKSRVAFKAGWLI